MHLRWSLRHPRSERESGLGSICSIRKVTCSMSGLRHDGLTKIRIQRWEYSTWCAVCQVRRSTLLTTDRGMPSRQGVC